MHTTKSRHRIGEEHEDSDSDSGPGSDSENPNSKIRISFSADYNEQERNFKKISLATKCLVCCSSCEALLATKSVALKLLKFSHMKLYRIKTPSRVLVILCFLYLFSLRHHQSFNLYIILLITLSIILLFILKFFNKSKTCTPVVWSIGPMRRHEDLTVSGFLVKVYNNGDIYEGEFYKGRCSGSGVYYHDMNGRYEGDWIDQKYDGYGVETWAKGSRYRGQYRQGVRHGFGVYRSYAGDMYAGGWMNGQCHGYGLHTCEDGSKYFGEFKSGLKHGTGHYSFRNGDLYAGEYFADKMHGYGVYNFANGHRYEGSWHEGKRQGFGLYTFRNGDTQSGHWEDGALSINPHHPMSISHAKVLKAVEEARRFADKAATLMNLDEKVNRTMAASNRAANAARVAAVKAIQSRVHYYDDTTIDIV